MGQGPTNKKVFGGAVVNKSPMGGAVVNKQAQPVLGSYKKGGKVKKTGLYKLHKGEKVLTKKKAKMLPRVMKKD